MSGRKNTINESSGSTTIIQQNGTISPAPAFTAETTITTDFYAEGVNDFNRILVTFKLFKLGTLVTMVMKPLITSISDKQWFGRTNVIPEAFRATHHMLQPFSPIRGLSNGRYEVQSDITGACHTFANGDLELWREPYPGTGKWSGDNRGWLGFTMTWATAT